MTVHPARLGGEMSEFDFDDVQRFVPDDVLKVRASTDLRVEFVEHLFASGQDRRAAILCMELGADQSAEIMGKLDPLDSQRLANAFAEVGQIKRAEAEQVLAELKQHSTI